MDEAQLSLGYRATMRRKFAFYLLVPRYYWYLFERPRKDERLSQPWNHPVFFLTRDTLATRLLHLNHEAIDR